MPFGRRSLGERVPSGPTGGLYLSYPNGTLIEPLAVGKSKTQSDTKVKRDCTNGWENDSYKPNGDWYIATFETQMVTGQVPPDVEDRVITITYDQTVETSTHFDVTIGDPFGVISIGAGFEFSTSTSMGYQVEVSVPANQSGYVGFTPAYKCTRGTITKCGGEVQPEEESCTPFVTNGVVQGDHLLVLGD